MTSDSFQSLLWLCIGVVVLFLSSKYSMGSLSEPGPGALPFGLGLIFVLLSTILFFRSWRSKEPDREKSPRFSSRWRKVFLIIFFLSMITFLLENLGYLISVFLLTAISMSIMDPRRWFSALLLGIFSSFFSYLLFDVWLKIQLPKGLFYF